MGRANATNHPSASAKHYYKADAGIAPQVVSDTKGNLYGFEFENNSDTAAVYVLFYNDAAPTVGVDTPVFTFKVPEGAVFGKDAQGISLHYFDTACSFAVSSLRDGSAPPGAALTVNFWYSTQE